MENLNEKCLDLFPIEENEWDRNCVFCVHVKYASYIKSFKILNLPNYMFLLYANLTLNDIAHKTFPFPISR